MSCSREYNFITDSGVGLGCIFKSVVNDFAVTFRCPLYAASLFFAVEKNKFISRSTLGPLLKFNVTVLNQIIVSTLLQRRYKL